ncbi:unnamed protein product [Sphagnum jensenii]|uniref:Secreted protein n=1 Tax=Sphagnum jensenii TaxID=128206 RepID=A0ABP1AMG8_9BRYO
MTSLPTSMLVPTMAGLWSTMTAGTPSSSNFSASQCTDQPLVVDPVQTGAWPRRAKQAQRPNVQRCGHGYLEALRHPP